MVLWSVACRALRMKSYAYHALQASSSTARGGLPLQCIALFMMLIWHNVITVFHVCSMQLVLQQPDPCKPVQNT